MKKKTMIGVVIGMAIIVGGFLALPKEVSDQINPFVSKKMYMFKLTRNLH